MFISYIEFFHSLHTKYLKRFSTKIQLMHTHIDTDIKFDEVVEINKETKKGLIEELNTGNIDKHLLNDEETIVSEISEEGIYGVGTRLPETVSYDRETSFKNIFNSTLPSNVETTENKVKLIQLEDEVSEFKRSDSNNIITVEHSYASEELTTDENISSYIEPIINDEIPTINNAQEQISDHRTVIFEETDKKIDNIGEEEDLSTIGEEKPISEEDHETTTENIVISENIKKKKSTPRKKKGT